MKRTVVTLAAATLVLGVLSACGAGGNTAQEPAASEATLMATGCVWQAFDATVRTGPHAGSAVSGQLVLAALDGTDKLYGHLFPAGGGGGVPVSGSHTDTTLQLSFQSELGTLDGAGAVDGTLCKEGVEGLLTGPAEGDAGDWIGVELAEYNLTVDPADLGGVLTAVPLTPVPTTPAPTTAGPPPSPNSTAGNIGPGAGLGQFDDREVSPSCIQSTSQGTTKITCANGATTCTTTYPAGGGAPTTICRPGHRPGVHLE